MKKLSVLALISPLSIVSFASANNSNLKLVNAYEKAPASNLNLLTVLKKVLVKSMSNARSKKFVNANLKSTKK